MRSVEASHIYEGLWQGSWPAPGTTVRDAGFSAVVLCAAEYQPPQHVAETFRMFRQWPPPAYSVQDPFPGVHVVYAPNDDDPDRFPSSKELTLAIRAARQTTLLLSRGKKVLVTCMQGRNRSGLVSALALHNLLGVSGLEAASMVQNKRPNSLMNPQFVLALSRLQAV